MEIAIKHIKPPAALRSQYDVNGLTYKHSIRFISKPPGSLSVSYPHTGVHVMFVDTQRDQGYVHHLSRYDDIRDEYRFNGETMNVFDIDLPLENIDQIWLGTETGTLQVGNVIVHSSQKATHFECDTVIGTDDCSAIVLTPSILPVVNPKARQEGFDEYIRMKHFLIITNIWVVLIGSVFYGGIMYPIDLQNTTIPFIYGGILGTLYLYLLQKHTDSVGTTLFTRRSSIPDTFGFVASQLRVPIVTGVSIAYIEYASTNMLLPYMIGFFTYKLVVMLTPLND